MFIHAVESPVHRMISMVKVEQAIKNVGSYINGVRGTAAGYQPPSVLPPETSHVPSTSVLMQGTDHSIQYVNPLAHSAQM